MEQKKLTNNFELIENEINLFQFDRLKTNDVIQISTENEVCYITILAVTGNVYIISKVNDADKFDKLVTFKELKEYVILLAHNLILNTDAECISIDLNNF